MLQAKLTDYCIIYSHGNAETSGLGITRVLSQTKYPDQKFKIRFWIRIQNSILGRGDSPLGMGAGPNSIFGSESCSNSRFIIRIQFSAFKLDPKFDFGSELKSNFASGSSFKIRLWIRIRNSILGWRAGNGLHSEFWMRILFRHRFWIWI